MKRSGENGAMDCMGKQVPAIILEACQTVVLMLLWFKFGISEINM